MAHLRNIFAYFDSQKLIGEQKKIVLLLSSMSTTSTKC